MKKVIPNSYALPWFLQIVYAKCHKNTEWYDEWVVNDMKERISIMENQFIVEPPVYPKGPMLLNKSEPQTLLTLEDYIQSSANNRLVYEPKNTQEFYF